MVYRFVFTETAKGDIEKLEVQVKKRLHKKLLHFAETEDMSAYAKKLTNSRAGEYRLRIGDYRVVFDMKGSTCVVLRVQHRGDIYRNI